MEESILTQTYFQLIAFFGPKILMAIVCGGIIGFERELKHKAAGIKTNMLICAGAALYTATSVHLSQVFAQNGFFGDPARLAAQIVSGIGFLGGGAIIQSRGTVVGLTTAATIWIVAAIGICVGLGYYTTALSSTIMVVGVLVAVTWFEDHVMGRKLHFASEITVEDPKGDRRKIITQLLDKHELILEDFQLVSKSENVLVLKIKFRGSANDHKKFLISLWALEGVREVHQE